MSVASVLSVADPHGAGGAVPKGALPGAGLLRLVQRFIGTGMAMARQVNRIARQRLEGQDLARMAPAGFDATLTNAFVRLAVGWTAALRERLLALAGRPAFTPGLPKAERGPRGRGAADYLPEGTPEALEDPRHDWRELAKPLRIGPGGVAVAAQFIEGLSDREVVATICDYLRKAAVQLGAEADLVRIAALEAAALALCPEADAEGVADPGKAEGGSGVWKAGSAFGEPESVADDGPPSKKPPD